MSNNKIKDKVVETKSRLRYPLQIILYELITRPIDNLLLMEPKMPQQVFNLVSGGMAELFSITGCPIV